MHGSSRKIGTLFSANSKQVAVYVWLLWIPIFFLASLGKSFADTIPLSIQNETTNTIGSFSKPILTNTEQTWLSAHPVIRVGVDPSYAPYSEVDANGYFVGEAADYINIISKQLGIQFKITNPKHWFDILDEVKQHRIDVIATAVALPERKKYLTFSGVYIRMPLVVMTRNDDFSIHSPEDLAHRVVALVQGYSSTEQVLNDHPSIKVLAVKSPLQGLIAVATGKADAYVGAVGVNLAIDRRSGISNLRIASVYKLDNGQSFAVRNDWSILAGILDKALAAIPESTKSAIQSRWVPEKIPVNHYGLPVFSVEEHNWIARHRPIRVGLFMPDEPNAFVNKNGSPEGFVTKYLDLIRIISGLDFKIVQMKNRKSLLTKLDAGLLDMVSVQTSPTKISKKYLLSDPIHHSSMGLFVLRNASFIGGLSDLSHKPVGLIYDFIGKAKLRRMSNIIPISEPDPLSALHAVIDGRLEAAAIGIDTGLYLLEKYKLRQLQMVHVISGEETSLRFAIRKDNPELLDIVDRTLAATTSKESKAIRHSIFNTLVVRGVPVEEIEFWALLAVAAALSIFLLQSLRNNKRLREERERRLLADAKSKSNEQRFHNFFEKSQAGMAITSINYRWLNVNPHLCNMLGYTENELFGMTWVEMTHPEDIEADMAQFKRLASGEIEHYSMDKRFIHKNGDIVYTHLTQSSQHSANQTVECFLKTLVDITDRKLAEVKIKRLSQLYAALSQCNQAIVRCTNEPELLSTICQDAVNFGGMKMAWIGMVDKDSQRIIPVANFGFGTEYLDGIEISLKPDSHSFLGPTARSILEERPIWIQDFLNDPITIPWHDRARKFGWGAFGSIPLYRNDVVVGIFGLYSSETNVFDEPIQKLLIEMSSDISFALDNFDNTAERRRAVEKIQYQNSILKTQQETSLDAILVVDEHETIISYNHQFISMWQCSDPIQALENDEVILNDVLNQIDNTEMAATRFRHLNANHDEHSREEILLKDGRIIDRYSAPVIGVNGKYFGRIWYFRDITERKRAEERISYLANYDGLTGLPNRSQLTDHLKYALGLAKRRDGHVAMMFIDIDHFKNINDTLGHSIGDAFLVVIAKRLQSVLREEDTVARLGGDEFILMLSDCDNKDASKVAKKILEVIAEPCQVEQFDLAVTASIGIALYPTDGTDMETLFKSADNAMYRAKKKGRDGYRFFTAEMQVRASRNMQLVNAMRHALDCDQFEVHYQPQFSMIDDRIIGAEALLRWTHPELGIISPAEFIPVAEDSGLILPVGEWVLRTAIKQLKRWIDDGYPPMIIAVNLSAVQFRHTSLPELVTHILNETGLPSKYLELELTEGVAMNDPMGAIAVMNNLHDRGIKMSIDDFGTGYSSLSYLKKFKVYKLKIDQSFVRDISTDQEDKAIVAAIISMSRNLGLQTIAEGVETVEQLAYLREQGCDEVQGYLFSKPLSVNDMDRFLHNKAFNR